MEKEIFIVLSGVTLIVASLCVFFLILVGSRDKKEGLRNYLAGMLMVLGYGLFGFHLLPDIREEAIKSYLSGKIQVEYRYKEIGGMMVSVDTLILFNHIEK